MVTIADFEASAPPSNRAVELRQAARERGGSRPRRVQASSGASLASIGDRIRAVRRTSTCGSTSGRRGLGSVNVSNAPRWRLAPTPRTALLVDAHAPENDDPVPKQEDRTACLRHRRGGHPRRTRRWEPKPCNQFGTSPAWFTSSSVWTPRGSYIPRDRSGCSGGWFLPRSISLGDGLRPVFRDRDCGPSRGARAIRRPPLRTG